jgi:hypothetical protein
MAPERATAPSLAGMFPRILRVVGSAGYAISNPDSFENCVYSDF